MKTPEKKLVLNILKATKCQPIRLSNKKIRFELDIASIFAFVKNRNADVDGDRIGLSPAVGGMQSGRRRP